MIRLIVFLAISAAATYFAATSLSHLTNVNADSGWYFFDSLFERIKLVATNNPEERLNKLLEFMNEKSGELKALEAGGKDNLLEKVYTKHEQYVLDAIEAVEKMKEEGADVSEFEKEIVASILERKEILSEAYTRASGDTRPVFEQAVKSAESTVQTILEKASEPVKEVIVYQAARADAAIQDKREEAEVKKQDEEKNALSSSEKLYYIWIDELYAKNLPRAQESFYVRAHLKRRDEQCKFFSGELVLKIGNKEWKNAVNNVNPNDDLWLDIGPAEFASGNYSMESKLFDKTGRLISEKKISILVD